MRIDHRALIKYQEQSDWLGRQSEGLGQPRTTILKHILNEWLFIHSDDVPDELRVAEAAEIVRQAVSEFMLSHHEVFLP